LQNIGGIISSEKVINIYKMYNAFNLADFNFTTKAIELFEEKCNLTEDPIVYIGNYQEIKGVLESYNVSKI